MIVDAHNDLLLELVHRDAEADPFGAHWLPKLRRGGVRLQVCPVYTTNSDLRSGQALQAALRQVGAYQRVLQEHPDQVLEVTRGADVDRVVSDERLGLLLSMEGMEPLGYDPSLIEVFWELGVRMVSLTWNRRNPFADGAAEPAGGGLSRLGDDLVERLLERGVIIDLAHASERTFWDVVERANGAPLVVSHSACRAVYDTPRNLADEQLEAIARSGGVLGIMLVPLAIDSGRLDIERAVDHIEHALSVMGDGHVGLGGDFFHQIARAIGMGTGTGEDWLLPGGMQIDAALEGLAGPEDYPVLIEAMRRRGFDDARLEGVMSKSFLEVLRKALPAD